MQRDENGLTFTRPQLELKLFSSETERLSASTGTQSRETPTHVIGLITQAYVAFTAH